MNQFIGTKVLTAQPMHRAAMCLYRGWELPANENGSDDGYLVEYQDGGKANDPRHEGYISWSPKDVFEAAYRPTHRMTFGDAIVMLKAGERVQRAGWNGKGMWLYRVNGNSNFSELTYEHLPFIAMKTVDNKTVPWLASQTDMLAEDWRIA